MPEGTGTMNDAAVIGTTTGALPFAPLGSGGSNPVAPSIESARIDSFNAKAWRHAGSMFALGFTLLIVLYLDTVLDLLDAWGRSGTYAHGYMIFPVSGWLIWRLRDRLKTIVPEVQPLALVPLVGCGLMWLTAHSAAVHAPEQYAFIAMFPCLVWAVFGNNVTKRILYPLAFLFFAVPVGDFLMPTLMDHTANFTVAALRLSGVPVFREGNYFTIPSGSWSVVEACSGLRYLISSITLGVLFAYLNYRSAWRRAAFVAAAILVPIMANWLRAYMIVMLAHMSSNKLATGVDHIIYGWLFFGLVMMLLFWVGNFWRDDDEPQADALDKTIDAAPASAKRTTPRAIVAMTAAVIAVAAPWPALGHLLERMADAPHPGSIAIDHIDGWRNDASSFTSFTPHFDSSRSASNQAFLRDGQVVLLYMAYYSGQMSNGLLITGSNDVVRVGDKVWGAINQEQRNVPVAGQNLAVVRIESKGDTVRGHERLLSWSWYWVNGRLTTSRVLAKAYTALDKLTGRGDDSAVIVLTTAIEGESTHQAEATLAAFAAAAQPQIAARLAAVHDQARQ
jgi:exosortase A